MELPFRFAEQADLYALWNEKRGARRMPARGDLSTDDLRPWLGSIHLIEVVEGGADFRYLVYGTNIARYYDIEMTRRPASEWAEDMRERAFRTYCQIVGDACPYLVRQNEMAQGRLHSFLRLVLPLSSHGERVEHIVTYLHMIPANEGDSGMFYHSLPPGPLRAENA